MMKQVFAISSIAALVVLSGCATYGGYQPTVDSSRDRHPEYISQDMAECKQLARQASSIGTETLKGGAAGALIGGAAGAAIGAVVGNPAVGAALGGAAGGIGGATNTGVDADNQFKRAYINCMRGRGHAIIN